MKIGHGEKMTRKQEGAIAALLLHPTIGQAATAVGVAEITLWRWLQKSDFVARYQAARAMAVSQAISQLQRLSSKAVDTLEQVMDAADSSDTARVSAAKIVLELGIKETEYAELRRRITALEELEQGAHAVDEPEEAPIVSFN